jgi:hypothetical protein
VVVLVSVGGHSSKGSSAISNSGSGVIPPPTTSPASSPTAPPTTGGVPAGYAPFVDQTDGFSIAVPTAWRQLDPTSPGAAAIFAQLGQDNPNLKTVLGPDLSTLISKQVKILALDAGSQNGFASSVNVIARPEPGIQSSDLAQIARQLPAEYAQLGATLLGTSMVTLGGEQALQETLDLPLHDLQGAAIVARETQYFVGANDFLYTVTLAGDSPDLPTIASTFHLQ